MLTVTYVGRDEVKLRFDTMSDRIHKALLISVTGFSLILESYVKTNKLAGQVLNHISGRLQGSIHSDVEDNPQSVIGRVYSAGVNYAAIHEYGGQIPDRYPVNAQALHFFVGGKEVFAKFARGFTMPERSYLRSSLEDNRERIVTGMTDAVKKAAAE